VGNCCYVAVCSAAQGASASTRGGEGRGLIVADAHLQLVTTNFFLFNTVSYVLANKDDDDDDGGGDDDGSRTVTMSTLYSDARP